MPRDLFSSNSKDESFVASPESQTPNPEVAEIITAAGDDDYREETVHGDDSRQSNIPQFPSSLVKADRNHSLHPYVQTLSISNLESCVALENAVFPEQERCSREKVNGLLPR